MPSMNKSWRYQWTLHKQAKNGIDFENESIDPLLDPNFQIRIIIEDIFDPSLNKVPIKVPNTGLLVNN